MSKESTIEGTRRESNRMTRSRINAELIAKSLRVTKQRQEILSCVRAGGDWHFTPEEIFRRLVGQESAVTLATVYNTLHRFSECGLIRKLNVGAGSYVFDSNLSQHHHATDLDTGEIFDIPQVSMSSLPHLPSGYQLDSADVMLYIRSGKRSTPLASSLTKPLAKPQTNRS